MANIHASSDADNSGRYLKRCLSRFNSEPQGMLQVNEGAFELPLYGEVMAVVDQDYRIQQFEWINLETAETDEAKERLGGTIVIAGPIRYVEDEYTFQVYYPRLDDESLEKLKKGTTQPPPVETITGSIKYEINRDAVNPDVLTGWLFADTLRVDHLPTKKGVVQNAALMLEIRFEILGAVSEPDQEIESEDSAFEPPEPSADPAMTPPPLPPSSEPPSAGEVTPMAAPTPPAIATPTPTPGGPPTAPLEPTLTPEPIPAPTPRAAPGSIAAAATSLLMPCPDNWAFTQANVDRRNKRMGIRFQVTPADPNLESLKAKLIEKANEVWHHPGGVELYTTAQSTKSIPVELVDAISDGGASNGGLTLSPLTSQVKIKLEVKYAKDNHFLLAHELGHVLGVEHPDAVLAGDQLINGSQASIAVPNLRPNLGYNTVHNLSVINRTDLPLTLGQKLETITKTDAKEEFLPKPSFLHHIRNFPYDDGLRDFNIEDWGKSSDVWNITGSIASLSAEPEPGLGAFFEHTDPDSTTSNFLCVRVHTCKTLNHNVQVHIFLATPKTQVSQHMLLHKLNIMLDFSNQFLPRPTSPAIRSAPWDVSSLANAGQWTPESWIVAVSSSNADETGFQELVNVAASGQIVSKIGLMKFIMCRKNIAARRPNNDDIQEILT